MASTVTINAEVHALMKCVSKDRNRYGLDGLFISKGRIRATNGSVLIEHRIPGYDGPDVLFRINWRGTWKKGTAGSRWKNAVPEESAEVDFAEMTEYRTYPFLTSRGNAFAIEIVKGEFPDTDKVFGGLEFGDEWGINPDLLKTLSGAMTGPSQNMALRRSNTLGPIKVRNTTAPHQSAIIMPTRVD